MSTNTATAPAITFTVTDMTFNLDPVEQLVSLLTLAAEHGDDPAVALARVRKVTTTGLERAADATNAAYHRIQLGWLDAIDAGVAVLPGWNA